MTDGGEGGAGLVRTELHKQKISLATKGKKKKPLTEEHKKQISKFFTGRPNKGASRPGESNTFYGKKHSEDTLKYFSEAKQGEKNPMFGRKQNRVCCIPCQRETSVNALVAHHKH